MSSTAPLVAGQASSSASASASAPGLLAPPSSSTRPIGTGPRLQWLSLRLCGIRSEGARVVAAWLTSESASQLHSLALDQNEFGGRGARALALAIEQRGSGLPPGWFAAVDEQTGRQFYFRRDIRRNRGIGSAQWAHPVAADAGDADGGGEDGAPATFERVPLREFGVFGCELGDASLAAILEAIGSSRAPPPPSLRIGGNTLATKAIGALATLLERGGVLSLDIKNSKLADESGRWLAPLADALVGETPRRPRMRWPLGKLLGKRRDGGFSRTSAWVEPLLPSAGSLDLAVASYSEGPRAANGNTAASSTSGVRPAGASSAVGGFLDHV